MKPEKPFLSWLSGHFDRFITVKRAGGADYTTQRRLLLRFDRYVMDRVPESSLDNEGLMGFLKGLDLTPRARDNVISVVWQALSYARRHGASVEPLPPQPPKASRYWRLRQPRIVSAQEMAKILRAARRLPGGDGWRATTMATLLGLLYVTGMRIGEARALNVGDLSPSRGLLTIVSGKFGKSRVLPLRSSTVRALTCYIEHRQRPSGAGASDPIFLSLRSNRLSTPAIQAGVLESGRSAQIAEPFPRPHDFRHTFAVRQLARCYAEGLDFDRLLPTLSTYLGHTGVESTRSYLVANGTLFEHAARRFAEATRQLDEVPL